MTEEIIKAIKTAEEEASTKKAAALEKADALLKDAEDQAEKIKKTSAEQIKAYRESQGKEVEKAAQDEYDKAVKKAQADARSLGDKILLSKDVPVSEIVGRIVRGDF